MLDDAHRVDLPKRTPQRDLIQRMNEMHDKNPLPSTVADTIVGIAAILFAVIATLGWLVPQIMRAASGG